MTVRDFFKTNKLLQITLALASGMFFLLMLIYSYQGWFTRYMADDYCNAVLFSKDAAGGLVDRYLTGFGGNRYSNIWLVGISEFLGGLKSIPYLPVIHIMLWVAGLIWVMTEVKKLLKADWSFAMTAFWGLSIGFFALIQAPNLYQIVYWRSSMTTHFAPVVYGTLLIAYLINQANKAALQELSFSAYVIAFVTAFIVGGFSEPADAVQVTVLVLAIAAVWFWGQNPTRNRILKLLGWTLGAALLSLVVMSISPANSRRLGDNTPGLALLIHDSFLYGLIFIQKTLSELPLPTFISILTPALLMGLYFKAELSKTQKRNLWIVIIAILFLMYLLIVASFSPSVLGQGYPVDRVRFYARLIMTLSLMFDGALLGALFSRRLSHPVLQWAMLAVFFAAGVVYPLRAVVTAYHQLPAYYARAEAWDKRDAIIRDLKAQGQTQLIVEQFDGVYSTKELDTYPTHWVNKCAAKYYGVKKISAIPYK
jgi:ABC-type multidrug transport system fused ATPase/permease subunit